MVTKVAGKNAVAMRIQRIFDPGTGLVRTNVLATGQKQSRAGGRTVKKDGDQGYPLAA